jgi:hypothetical protein
MKKCGGGKESNEDLWAWPMRWFNRAKYFLYSVDNLLLSSQYYRRLSFCVLGERERRELSIHSQVALSVGGSIPTWGKVLLASRE